MTLDQNPYLSPRDAGRPTQSVGRLSPFSRRDPEPVWRRVVEHPFVWVLALALAISLSHAILVQLFVIGPFQRQVEDRGDEMQPFDSLVDESNAMKSGASHALQHRD